MISESYLVELAGPGEASLRLRPPGPRLPLGACAAPRWPWCRPPALSNKQVRDKQCLTAQQSDSLPHFSLRRAFSASTFSASSRRPCASSSATLASSSATRPMAALPSASSWAACSDSSTRAGQTTWRHKTTSTITSRLHKGRGRELNPIHSWVTMVASMRWPPRDSSFASSFAGRAPARSEDSAWVLTTSMAGTSLASVTACAAPSSWGGSYISTSWREGGALLLASSSSSSFFSSSRRARLFAGLTCGVVNLAASLEPPSVDDSSALPPRAVGPVLGLPPSRLGGRRMPTQF